MTCSSITITAEGISRQDGTSGSVTVLRDEIRAIKLSYDPRSRRPFLRFFSGFVLAATGLVFLIAAFMMAEGGVLQMRIQALAFAIPVVPLALWSLVGTGLWLILGVFRGCYAITVTLDKGMRTFHFSESTDIGEILRFLARAGRDLGYTVDTSLTRTMYLREAPEGRATADKE